MSRLYNTWRKAHHAGFRWTARAVLRRAVLSASRNPILRAHVERAHQVDDNQFLDGIDFGNRAHGDIAGRYFDEPRGRHFLDYAEQTAALIRQRFPDAVMHTIERADAVCRREFHLLGRDISFGNTIDWFWIPDTDARWPEVHIDQLPPRFYNDADRPGDVKYPWELNRHQHFTTLAKAFLYTRDEKYLVELERQFEDWSDRNPFRVGINWYSSLEIAIRLIAWTDTIALLRSANQPELATVMLRSAYQHAHYLNRTLTTHWLVANNHLVGETAGLFAFAAAFPEFHTSARWRDRALQLLTAALDQQIFPDGVNREQATGYHRFVLDFLVLVDRLAALNDIPVPNRFSEHLKSMLHYEAAVAPSDGIAPSIGDCDDGRGLMLSELAAALNFRGWQPYGAVRFDDLKLAAAAGEGSEEPAWLLGPDGWRAFESMPRNDSPKESLALATGGHYVMRSGQTTEDAYVFVRCGPFGLGGEGSSVHSHADLMAPVIRWRGRDLAVDAGTYGYLCEAARRDSLRAGRAHNTFLPENADQGVLRSLWNWFAVPHGETLSWFASDDETVLSGRVSSPMGFVHERTLTLVRKPLMLSIEDSLSYSKCMPAIWRLHLAPDLNVEEMKLGALRIYDGADFAVALAFTGYSGIEIRDTGFAPRYGVWQPIRCIELITNENPARGRVVLHDLDITPPDPGKG